MGVIDTLLNMSRDELRVLLAIMLSSCGLFGYIFFLLGKARGWADRRREIARDNIVIESAILRDLPDGRIELAIETADRMPPLAEVLCDGHLEARARTLVATCKPGDPLFGHGPDHYKAMERVGVAITGADLVATQSALFGRHGEYHLDRTAFIITGARGEDGLQMARIIKANTDSLERLLAKDVAGRIVPLRQVHLSYLPILLRMADHYRASKEQFERQPDERTAGRLAPVWTAYIRSHRTSILTEEEVRRLVREELSRRTEAPPRDPHYA